MSKKDDLRGERRGTGAAGPSRVAGSSSSAKSRQRRRRAGGRKKKIELNHPGVKSDPSTFTMTCAAKAEAAKQGVSSRPRFRAVGRLGAAPDHRLGRAHQARRGC